MKKILLLSISVCLFCISCNNASDKIKEKVDPVTSNPPSNQPKNENTINAPIKFFLQAPGTIRAKRRQAETAQTKNRTEKIIKSRDETDSLRTISPLRPATDAIVLETGINNVEEMIHMAIKHINRSTI